MNAPAATRNLCSTHNCLSVGLFAVAIAPDLQAAQDEICLFEGSLWKPLQWSPWNLCGAKQTVKLKLVGKQRTCNNKKGGRSGSHTCSLAKGNALLSQMTPYVSSELFSFWTPCFPYDLVIFMRKKLFSCEYKGSPKNRKCSCLLWPLLMKYVTDIKCDKTAIFLHITHRRTTPIHDKSRATQPHLTPVLGVNMCTTRIVLSAQELFAIAKMDRRARWGRTTLGEHVVRRLACVLFSLHFSSHISRIALLGSLVFFFGKSPQLSLLAEVLFSASNNVV